MPDANLVYQQQQIIKKFPLEKYINTKSLWSVCVDIEICHSTALNYNIGMVIYKMK